MFLEVIDHAESESGVRLAGKGFGPGQSPQSQGQPPTFGGNEGDIRVWIFFWHRIQMQHEKLTIEGVDRIIFTCSPSLEIIFYYTQKPKNSSQSTMKNFQHPISSPRNMMLRQVIAYSDAPWKVAYRMYQWNNFHVFTLLGNNFLL